MPEMQMNGAQLKIFTIFGILMCLIFIKPRVLAQSNCAFDKKSYSICRGDSLLLKAGSNTLNTPEFSLKFDGKGYMSAGNDAALSLNNTSFTISIWINPSTIKGKKVIISKPFTVSGPYGSYYLYLQDGMPRFVMKVSGDKSNSAVMASSSTTLKTNKWSHIVVAGDKDSSQILLYVDGLMKGKIKWKGTAYKTGDYDLLIGAHFKKETGYIDKFEGKIDQVGIWDRLLTLEELERRTFDKTDLLAAWDFSEGSGSTTKDLSENKNHAKLINLSWSPDIPNPKAPEKITYQWSTGDTTTQIIVKPLLSTTYHLNLRTLEHFCYDSVRVIVNPTTSAILGKVKVKQNELSIYSVSQTAGSTYDWTVEGGNIISGAGTNAIQVQWGTKGPGTLTVRETTSQKCIGEDVKLNVVKK